MVILMIIALLRLPGHPLLLPQDISIQGLYQECICLLSLCNVMGELSSMLLKYRIAGNFHGGLIFIIFMTALTVTKFTPHESLPQ